MQGQFGMFDTTTSTCSSKCGESGFQSCYKDFKSETECQAQSNCKWNLSWEEEGKEASSSSSSSSSTRSRHSQIKWNEDATYAIIFVSLAFILLYTTTKMVRAVDTVIDNDANLEESNDRENDNDAASV